MKKTLPILSLCLMTTVSGCAKASAKEIQTEKEADIITLSDHTETSSEILLKNVSEANIVAMFIKNNTESTFKTDLLVDGGHILPKEKRLLYVELSEGQTYQIGLIAQGRTYILHSLPFDEADTFNIHITDEYAYLTYKKGKKTISTEDIEKEASAGEAEILQALEEQVPVDDNQAPSMDFTYPQTYVDPYANYQNYYYNYSYYEPIYYPETYDTGGDSGYVEPEPVVPTPVTPEPTPTPTPEPAPAAPEAVVQQTAES